MENISQQQLEEQPQASRVLKIAEPLQGRVLIVEDEEELVELLEFNLVRRGFEVSIAQDGLEACRMIGREKPELILLDLMLPLLDGWEICRMVRSHHDQRIARTPIIMLSALGSVEDRLKGYGLGADLYLPKPYVISEVMLKSGQLVEKHREYLTLFQQVNSLQKWTQLQDNWQQALFHELKNQLTVISGMAQHLCKNDGLPQRRSEQFVAQISSSSHYLGALAENYLLVRQLEENPDQLQCEPLLLSELLGTLKPMFAPLAEEKSCELSIDCPEPVILNLHPVGLKIILSSLLDNALKYSTLDSRVSLRTHRAAGHVKLQIEDDGPGIPAAERERVFDKFYRCQARGSQVMGSGLGLYMARTLAEAMGGSLRLLPQSKPGCCFELSFPLDS